MSENIFHFFLFVTTTINFIAKFFRFFFPKKNFKIKTLFRAHLNHVAQHKLSSRENTKRKKFLITKSAKDSFVYPFSPASVCCMLYLHIHQRNIKLKLYCSHFVVVVVFSFVILVLKIFFLFFGFQKAHHAWKVVPYDHWMVKGFKKEENQKTKKIMQPARNCYGNSWKIILLRRVIWDGLYPLLMLRNALWRCFRKSL